MPCGIRDAGMRDIGMRDIGIIVPGASSGSVFLAETVATVDMPDSIMPSPA